MIDKEALRRSIDGRAYLERWSPSAKFNREAVAKVPCPWHDDETPSLTLYAESGNPHSHCFGCGAHGDIFALRCKVESIDFPESLRRFASEAGQNSAPRPGRAKPPGPSPEELEADAERFGAAMTGRVLSSLCKSSRVSETTVRRFRLRWAESWSALVIPTVAGGKVASLCYRCVEVNDGKRSKRVWRSRGTKAAVFNGDELDARPDAPVLAIEGERDANAFTR